VPCTDKCLNNSIKEPYASIAVEAGAFPVSKKKA
jgi:hypothetical protein